MADQFDWVIVTKYRKEIGAIGFLGNDAAVIAAFHDDRDWNNDGALSVAERASAYMPIFGRKGRQVAEVAMQARVDMNIVMRDATFTQQAAQVWLNYARGLVADGIWVAYFQRGVKMTGAGIAKVVTRGTVKELAVRKGFEMAAKRAFERGMGL